jgi:competence protein ComEC
MPGDTPPSAAIRLFGLTRRPALTAALLFILGILLHNAAPNSPRLWIGLAAVATVGAILVNRFTVFSSIAVALSLPLAGVAVAQLEHFHFRADQIAGYLRDEPVLAEVELVIDQPPRVLAPPAGAAGRRLPPRQVARGQVARVKTLDGWRDASGAVLLRVDEPLESLAYGQRVAVLGTLSRPAPAMNPGQFDWARYYREQRVLAALDAQHAGNVRVLAPGGAAPLAWLRARARAALEKGFAREDAVDHALLRALLLGDSDPQLREIQDEFQKTGTSHHLSISGMHVAVLGAVVFLLCRLVRLSPRKSAWVMMFFVVLYGLVALPAPPVVRSIILCLAFGVGVVMRRSVDGLQLLALTVIVMLAWHPMDLYNAGFQLSFGTVLGLMIFATPLSRLMDRQSEDERVLMSLGIAPTRTQSVRRWAIHHATAMLAAGLVAWAVSAPLIVQHFDQLNPWAVPASLLLAIPVFGALVAGMLKVVLTLIVPGLASWWAALALLPVAAMRHTVAWLASWPGSDMPLPAVPVLLPVVYYLLLLLPLIPTARRGIKWLCRGGAAAACATALMLPLVIGFAPRSGRGELKVTLLSVGAGQCAVVQTPGGKTLLIDAGSSTVTELHHSCLAPFLRHEGVRHVDAIYVSHANFDHFSAVVHAARDYTADQVVLTPLFEAHAAKNLPARMMLSELRKLNCPVKTAVAGQRVLLDDQCALEVLWPPAGARLEANESCHVLRLTCGDRAILFTGDIQQVAEAALARDGVNLHADVLVAPHHGSAEPTTAAFVEAVGAAYVLASNDRTLSGKQREFDRLIPREILYRTHECGAVTVRVTGDGRLTVGSFLHR